MKTRFRIRSRRLHRLGRVAAAVAAIGLMLPTLAADAVRVGAYDFSYATAGDVSARPIQVFDDGRSTFMQFRPGTAIPAIFSTKTGAPQLVAAVLEGPYVRIPDVHGSFVLQAGRAQAQVLHSGGVRAEAPRLSVNTPEGKQPHVPGSPYPQGAQVVASIPPVPMTPDNAPVIVDDRLERNSYATPRKGDRIVWQEREPKREEAHVWFPRGSAVLGPEGRRTVATLARAGGRARFTVIGRDDDTYKEGLDRQRAHALRDALVKAGAGEDRITVRTGIVGKGRGSTWSSDLIVETESADVEAPGTSGVVSNLQALVRAGVLRQDQAEAIAANRGAVMRPAPATGVQASAVSALGAPAAPAAPATIPSGGFTLTASDKTVQGAIRRWAAALNYQLVWDAPARLDAAILGDVAIPGSSIQEALNRLLAGLGEKGYALDATVYANRVIRLTAAATPPAPSPAGQASTQPAATANPPVPAPPAAAPAPDRRRPEPASKPQRTAIAQPTLEMRQDAGDVKRMFTRWAAESQWNVVWAAREQVPIMGDATLPTADFRSAADQVIAEAAKLGYRLRLAERGDRTLVVTGY